MLRRRRSSFISGVRFAAALATLVLCEAVCASPLWISHNTGPTSGGMEVVLEGGPFSLCPETACTRSGPPQVFFGDVPAASVTFVDSSTLKAITPAHFPGTVDVFAYQPWSNSGDGRADNAYTFIGAFPNSGVERILVPLLTGVTGGYETYFATEFSVGRKNDDVRPTIYGVQPTCFFEWCPEVREQQPLLIEYGGTYSLLNNGTPGRFVYVPKNHVPALTMELRVYDDRFGRYGSGTEIPLLRDRDFTSGRIVLLGVPTDPRLRNTLRIYSPAETAVRITIEGREPVKVLLTRPKNDVFTPYYAMFSDFPIGTSPVSVVIEPIPPVDSPAEPAPIWAFVSVTNNQTQMITTITPQP